MANSKDVDAPREGREPLLDEFVSRWEQMPVGHRSVRRALRLLVEAVRRDAVAVPAASASEGAGEFNIEGLRDAFSRGRVISLDTALALVAFYAINSRVAALAARVSPSPAPSTRVEGNDRD